MPFDLVPVSVARESFGAQWLLHYLPQRTKFQQQQFDNRGVAVVQHSLDAALQAANVAAEWTMDNPACQVLFHAWLIDPAGHPVTVDFLSFWAGGHLALDGASGGSGGGMSVAAAE